MGLLQQIGREIRGPETIVDEIRSQLVDADRYVFTEYLYEVLWEMVKNEQITMTMLVQHAQFPNKPTWIEFKNESHGRQLVSGSLIVPQSIDSRLKIYNVMMPTDIKNTPIVMFKVLQDWKPRGDDNYHMSLLYPSGGAEHEVDQWLQAHTRTMLFALFLVQQPRIVIQEDVKHDLKLQKSRAKSGKAPLLDYQRVYLKFGVLGSQVGIITKRADASFPKDVTEATATKRYHHVIGHFRVYHRGTDHEIVSWIEPHWRGDASKGVLIKEHVISKAKL